MLYLTKFFRLYSLKSFFFSFPSALLLLLTSCTSTATSDTLKTASEKDEAKQLTQCIVNDRDYLLSLNTVWDEIRKDFDFSRDVDNYRVRRHLAIYDRRQKYFNTINERANRYLYHVAVEVRKRGMPSEIALLPVIESGLDPFAYSHGRAAGMWQFIPSTAKIFKLESNWWYEGRRDVSASTQAALDYLQRLEKRFDGDWLKALAAYNSGSGTVRKAIKKNKRLGKGTDYWSLDLPKETKDYVPKLIALSQLIADPEKYSIKLDPIPYAPYFDQVDTGGQIDLSQAASLAEVNTDDIYLLNPGFNRWATDPGKNRHLLVPYENKFIFEENIQTLPNEDRLSWTRYTIKSGDTLSVIAQKNKVNTDFLKSINNLNNNSIRVGDTLMIPRPLEKSSSYSLSQEQRKQALSHRKKAGKQRISYKVKENDSFWSIGKKYNVGIRQLASWNGMAPGDTLRAGQTLNVWVNNTSAAQRKVFRKVYYTVRSGDSLSRIAQKFRVSVSNIQSWNNLYNKKYLKPGQQLVLHVNVAK
jgi:membrane-bound lytic murein transglycosylase D